jgi:hypothetical protein
MKCVTVKFSQFPVSNSCFDALYDEGSLPIGEIPRPGCSRSQAIVASRAQEKRIERISIAPVEPCCSITVPVHTLYHSRLTGNTCISTDVNYVGRKPSVQHPVGIQRHLSMSPFANRSLIW